jgi:hypothetical protein
MLDNKYINEQIIQFTSSPETEDYFPSMYVLTNHGRLLEMELKLNSTRKWKEIEQPSLKVAEERPPKYV